MRFAYADPPYLGMASRYAKLHPEAMRWDTIEAHQQLVADLRTFDAWAMSTTSVALRAMLPICPDKTRVMAWVKPFAYFKPGVNPAYCWEPLLVFGGRKKAKTDATVRDYCVANCVMSGGFFGMKPETFCHWMFDVLGAQAGDDFHDLFPGSGAVQRAWSSWCQLQRAWSASHGADVVANHVAGNRRTS